MQIRTPKIWDVKDCDVTPEGLYVHRRQLIKTFGLGTVAMATGCGLRITDDDPLGPVDTFVNPYEAYFPVSRNESYQVPERPLSDELDATRYNNFYEFSLAKATVWKLVGDFQIQPWQVEIGGLIRNPQVVDVEDLLNRFEMEERVYRFRCVEAWAMTVPWSGFAFSKLIEWADPLPEATHVRFITANEPEQMPGMVSRPDFPWPYYEGLRLDEAYNELCFMATGLYGRALPRQNGAPMRLVVPWKYGYKSIKSIVKIEFVADQPNTFWNDLAPGEYGFESNVDPDVPHPRWSQAQERLLTTKETVPTQKYNGYGAYVADLYDDG